MRPRPFVWLRWLRIAALCAVAHLAAAAHLRAQDWRGPEALEVRVEDARGKALEGAEVVLDYASRDFGGPAPLLTDAKGRMAIGGLAPGRWALEVRKPGFMSFRAEIALSAGEKPEIVMASQHNVPGAVSTLRVRLAGARNAPSAPARIERVAVAPVETVAAEPPAPAAPAPPSPAAAPSVAAAAAPKLAAPPAEAVAPTEASPATAPAAPPPPVAPRLSAAAPIARTCYECRPGESARLAEAVVAAGGGRCPADLAAQLAAAPVSDLAALVTTLPTGCAVLRVDLPANSRYSGFRYEAAGGDGRSADCLAGRLCPAGACRFPVEPVVKREGDATVVLAPFESDAERRAGFVVYWRRGR